MDAQLKRGILDICVLTSLLKEDSYGYQMLKDISSVIAISESTLYPILRRLEQAKCLETYNVIIDNRVRKYFKILPLGKEKIVNFLKEWENIIDVYDYIRKNMEVTNE